MAESLAHKWGQCIGDALEIFVRNILGEVAQRHGLYLAIRLTVLRGQYVECSDVESAIAYLIEEEKSSRLREEGEQREAFEVQIRFNTGARIEATFQKRAEAIAFLRSFA